VHNTRKPGNIPTELGLLTNLRELTLEGRFDNSLPTELGSLGALTFLNVSATNLSGRIPGALKSLLQLSLYVCPGLKGLLPVEFSNLSKLLEITMVVCDFQSVVVCDLQSVVPSYGFLVLSCLFFLVV
jgi:hypothetical protein